MNQHALWTRVEFDGELFFDAREGATLENVFAEAWAAHKESGKPTHLQFNGVAISIWDVGEE